MRQPISNTTTTHTFKTYHISTDLYSPSSFRKLGIFSAIRPMSVDEIRPQGRGLAQLATLNTAAETRRGQLHGSRGTVDRTPVGQLATQC